MHRHGCGRKYVVVSRPKALRQNSTDSGILILCVCVATRLFCFSKARKDNFGHIRMHACVVLLYCICGSFVLEPHKRSCLWGSLKFVSFTKKQLVVVLLIQNLRKHLENTPSVILIVSSVLFTTKSRETRPLSASLLPTASNPCLRFRLVRRLRFWNKCPGNLRVPRTKTFIKKSLAHAAKAHPEALGFPTLFVVAVPVVHPPIC